MKKIIFLLLCLPMLTLRAAVPTDVEFLEAFAWGDRPEALKTLVPDTEDWFYYHCLHYQLANDRLAFKRILDQWAAKNRNNWNSRMEEMRRRQTLIEFDQKPDAAWSILRDDLGLTFSHRPRDEQRTAKYPSALNPSQYVVDVFMQEAQRRGLLDNLTHRGLELIQNEDMDPDLRRAWLGRLTRPDVPGLVDKIHADLDYKDSRGFGHHDIHRMLTLAQLEELGTRRPALLREEAYIAERITRIPTPPGDFARDAATATAYYQQVWDFVKTLEPMHNSLKAGVLYNLLDHKRRVGPYDEELFRAYLALPRQVNYIARELLQQLQRQDTPWVNFNYAPGRDIALPPIHNEEPLVREYLVELLKSAPDTSTYLPLFEKRWLEAVFAESKILNGVGKPEDWASRLSPPAYQAILERVELNFAPQNVSRVPTGAPVSVLVDVKKVDSLLVKIHEIQTFNYYSTQRAPVDQAVDLDGMIATHERSIKLDANPGRRVRQTLALPEINHRGVYVVELIGGGVSSRALLHVGQLETITQPTAAGQVVMVLNDLGETVKTATLWMDGREFTANEKGLILLPFSENPGVRFAILRDGDFCSPEQIDHLGEDYSFTAGIHLDAQNLIRRSAGSFTLRPDFRIHGIPLDPALLGQVKVTLAAIDAKGSRTEREYTAEFNRDSEWMRDFYVPDALRTIEVTVQAKLKKKTNLEEITLRDSRNLQVNGARAGDTLRQLFLTPHANGWAVELRGLNGEPVAGVPLQVYLHHPAFTQAVDLSVTTDAAGRVELGPLATLSRIQVTGPDNLRVEQALESGVALLPSRLHLLPKQTVSLPYPSERLPDLKAASLFAVRGDTILSDASAHVNIADGQLTVAGLAPGEYRLLLHESGDQLTLEVCEGEARSGFILGEHRRLQQTGLLLPSVASVKKGADELAVTIRNVSPSTRVLVRAFRYTDAGSNLPVGEGFAPPSERTFLPTYAQYISGRNIGDEYRYVLERRFREAFAGTLLERPGLILNPWMLRETTAEQEVLRQDQAYQRGRQLMNEVAKKETRKNREQLKEDGRRSQIESRDAGGGFRYGGGARMDSEASHRTVGQSLGGRMPVSQDIGYDFLPRGSRSWVNLTPDAQGQVKIPLQDLGEQTAVDVLVLDRFGTSRVRQRLTDTDYKPQEVRLLTGLKPDASFSRQKTVRKIEPGQPVVFPDLATTRYQVIRDFGRAFDLLQTLAVDDSLGAFAFLKDWPKLDEKTKREKYGEFACHELHLFFHQRDRAFFDAVVKPYLLNKKDKTLVDRWLLDALLPEDTRLDRLVTRNALELALLARRGGNAAAIQAQLREAWELMPPDPEGFAQRVRIALLSSELDEVASLGRDKQQFAAESVSKFKSALPSPVGMSTSELKAEAMSSVREESARSPASPPAPGMTLSLAEAVDGDSMEMPQEEMALMDMPMDDFDAAASRLYRALPKTKEWAEQNYYQVRPADDVATLVPVNGFWRDVAAGLPLSDHLLEAHSSRAEVLTALAFCGLPDEAPAPEEKTEGAQLTLSVAAPALLVSEQILPAEASKDDRPLLLSQQFFRPDDLYRYEGNEQIEKFVAGEFIRRTVYGARVTLTNPTASRRRLNVLAQLPLGAIPLRNGIYTDDVAVTLEPYTTQTVEYYFTFPYGGEFTQYPAHAAADEAVIGKAEPRLFHVVDAPTEVDKNSWGWISQYASPEDVLRFLDTHNLRRLDLNEMAWRLQDKSFFEKAAEFLQSRGLLHDTTFSYGIFHKDIPRTRIYLAQSPMAGRVGPVFASALLNVDPVDAKTYAHLEYDPLVNARTHPVGEKLKILNTALREQYTGFLFNSLYRAELDARERLALVYYLLLQDRLSEAGKELAKLPDAQVHEKLQVDYLRAWLALRNLEVDRALALVQPHLDHPVPRWTSRFQALAQAVKEARGAESAEVDDPSRQQDLDRLAAQSPSVELKAESGKLLATVHNLKQVTMNLYPMDIELLFSRKPFLAQGGADFAVIKPALTQEIAVKGNGDTEEIQLPKAYRDRNLMVEITGKGQRASVAWYANKLRVRKMESFGQIEVRSAVDGKPVPNSYVKVFGRSANGRESFWKDGYTDLRGRFDYVSLNDRSPEDAVEYSILILHPELGAEIRSAVPPTR